MQGQADRIGRRLLKPIQERLEMFPAVALLGPMQVGKTSLAPKGPAAWVYHK